MDELEVVFCMYLIFMYIFGLFYYLKLGMDASSRAWTTPYRSLYKGFLLFLLSPIFLNIVALLELKKYIEEKSQSAKRRVQLDYIEIAYNCPYVITVKDYIHKNNDSSSPKIQSLIDYLRREKSSVFDYYMSIHDVNSFHEKGTF